MIAGYAVPDFVSDLWHFYVAGITIVSIIGTMWFLKSQTTRKLAPGEAIALGTAGSVVPDGAGQ